MLTTLLRSKTAGGAPPSGDRVTQFGVEYLDGQSVGVRVTQQGVEYLDGQSAGVRITQVGIEYLTPRPIETRVTQFGLELLFPYVEEIFEPGQSFGPLVWAEVVGADNVIRAYAPVTLVDPAAYYSGYKVARLLGMGRIARALSDEQGQYESQRFSTTLDDVDRTWRDWLGDAATRLILNDRVVVRMISEPAWRLKLRPRTVAIGLVRDYRLE